jgi:hypothetical protein
MDLLSCVGVIDHIDADALSNSGSQQRSGELTVVRGSYYGSTASAVTVGQLNLTLAYVQHMNSGIRCKGQRAEAAAGGREPRQLQKGPASEQAG